MNVCPIPVWCTRQDAPVERWRRLRFHRPAVLLWMLEQNCVISSHLGEAAAFRYRIEASALRRGDASAKLRCPP